MTLREQLALARLDEFICSEVQVKSFRTIRPGNPPRVKSVRVKAYLHRSRRLIDRLTRSLVVQQLNGE